MERKETRLPQHNFHSIWLSHRYGSLDRTLTIQACQCHVNTCNYDCMTSNIKLVRLQVILDLALQCTEDIMHTYIEIVCQPSEIF